MRLSELPINPFDDNVVFEPHEAEESVPGLNEHPLDVLSSQFARIEAEPRPRRRPKGLLAQLVTSNEPGLGKSHLIGRLFRRLAGRATPVYLRPFQDPGSSWRSILLRVVQELNSPHDVPSGENYGSPTRLDVFSVSVMAHLLASLIEQGRADGENLEERARALRGDPFGELGRGCPDHYMASWVRDRFTSVLLSPFVNEVAETGMFLNTPARTWLKVLHGYSFNGQRDGVREACLEWIKGEGLSPEEMELLDLADRELPRFEESASRRNADAFGRLQDLLALAGYFQPFLFCFDQTELFTSGPELVAEFGAVVDQLVSFGQNHMVVVTANLEPWEREIRKQFQTAYRDRFANPIELSGITQEQGEVLVRQRLTAVCVDEADISRFCGGKWFAELFRDKKTFSVRGFLRTCARRFADLPGGVVSPEKTLADYYAQFEKEVRAKANRLVFDRDILRWALGKEVLGATLGGEAITHAKGTKQYLTLSWTKGGQTLHLGLEDSSDWRRWNTIIKDAGLAVSQSSRPESATRVVFLRTRDQRPIPDRGWKAIRERMDAAYDYFSVVVIEPEDLVAIYACYDLYASVLEGNTPFGREEMLEFVREKLKRWWMGLLVRPAARPPIAPPEAPLKKEQRSEEPLDGLIHEIRAAVSTRLFLSLDQLLGLLGGKPDRIAVLNACEAIPEIKIFSNSQATAIKWQPTRSQ